MQHGRIGKRRGQRGYSPTTLQGYDRSLRHVLIPEFGPRPAAEITAPEGQTFVDRLARDGLSRWRIANHLAVVRAIYSWACRPSRRLVPANPTIGVELPPVDEVKRDRAATADEAEALLAPLSPADRVPYALAFYAGLRRSEMDRLQLLRAFTLQRRPKRGRVLGGVSVTSAAWPAGSTKPGRRPWPMPATTVSR